VILKSSWIPSSAKSRGALKFKFHPRTYQSILAGFVEGRGNNVIFSVRGEIFPVHKIILATQSPVFKAQLYGKMKETKVRCMTVEDMEPDVLPC
jgi:speckle-type POZ protein